MYDNTNTFCACLYCLSSGDGSLVKDDASPGPRDSAGQLSITTSQNNDLNAATVRGNETVAQEDVAKVRQETLFSLVFFKFAN